VVIRHALFKHDRATAVRFGLASLLGSAVASVVIGMLDINKPGLYAAALVGVLPIVIFTGSSTLSILPDFEGKLLGRLMIVLIFLLLAIALATINVALVYKFFGPNAGGIGLISLFTAVIGVALACMVKGIIMPEEGPWFAHGTFSVGFKMILGIIGAGLFYAIDAGLRLYNG